MSAPLPSALLDAVIDAVCPGLAGATVLSPATGAGLSGLAYGERHAGVFGAVAAEAGGADAFLAMAPETRAAMLGRVEAGHPVAFRALVQAVIADYYEAPAVLTALGWRAEPPQPLGHRLQPMDEGLDALLERVRARGPIWRKAE
jgi:hypothetical protein